MDVSIRDRWEQIIAEAVNSGRFASPEDVVHEGLRLVEEREAKLGALRRKIAASIADPRPSLTDEDVGQRLREHARSYAARGEHA